QAKRVIAQLSELGIETVSAREPGGTPTGEVIRNILQHDLTGEAIQPEAEVLLFAASRAQLVRNIIQPALDRGAWVICDRFMDSTTAYQGYGRGFDVERIIRINEFAVGKTVPSMTLLLDLEVGDSLDRMRARNRGRKQGQDRFEREGQEFHEAVRQGYLALAARWPDRFRVIDSAGAEAAVAAAIWQQVRPLLGDRVVSS
ncbi:MAG: dTMP kinase, partial [Verrucomicrobia bacterium]|nr:dTMP kinase [Verrucomicrobiota bacterium]